MTAASAATETEITIRYTHFEMDEAQRRRSRIFFFVVHSSVLFTIHSLNVYLIIVLIRNLKWKEASFGQKSRGFSQ